MLIIRNISQLCSGPKGPVRLDKPELVTRHYHAAIGIDDGKIAWVRDSYDEPIPPGARVIDAGGRAVIPGLIDCHTHTVFAGTRENEFVLRAEGRSYSEIAESGGGIKSTVKAVQQASLEELVAIAMPRLHRMLEWGVTTVEVKSGYGLSVEDELKMLRVIKALNEAQPIELIPTYLAAHSIPNEFRGDGDGYLDSVLSDDVLKTIADEQLAEFADVFCERNVFTVEQSRRVLEKCREFGLAPRIHADQIAQIGASKLAAEVGAVSVDHLEEIDEESLLAIKKSGTIAVLLPACSFYLGVPQAPARAIIQAGVPAAVATDFNPGSCCIESLPLTMSIACTQMGMTPEQVLVASTANAAAVLKRADRIGSIEPGMQADITILDLPNVEQMFYFAGRNCTHTVIKAGEVVMRNR